MAMPMAYCVPGAEVELVLDLQRDEHGKAVTVDHDTWTEHKFKPAKIKRRGFIVKTKYPGDETYSSDCVEYVEVKFEKGKAPEKCLPTQLNLVKVANEAALHALKNETAIAKANDGLIDDIKNPVAVDRTGQGKRKTLMSAEEAKDFAKE
jgi:hypothetical protein